jgi:hypothetical protein
MPIIALIRIATQSCTRKAIAIIWKRAMTSWIIENCFCFVWMIFDKIPHYAQLIFRGYIEFDIASYFHFFLFNSSRSTLKTILLRSELF